MIKSNTVIRQTLSLLVCTGFILFSSQTSLAVESTAMPAAQQDIPKPVQPELLPAISENGDLRPETDISSTEQDKAGEAAPAAGTSQAETEPPATISASFTILSFKPEGNGLIDNETILQHLSGYLGEDKTSTDLFAARQAIFKLYSDANFKGVAVANPEVQDNGVVVLRIFEDDIDAAKPTADIARVEKSEEVTTASEPQQQAAEYENTLKESATETGISDAAEVGTAELAQAEITDEPTIVHQTAPLETTPTMQEQQIEAGIVPDSETSQPARPVPTGWVAKGWKAFESGQVDAALTIWQQGVDAMPGYRYMAFLGSYKYRSAAIRQLKLAGTEFHAIILRSAMSGEEMYYVMSTLDTPYDKQERQEKLADLRNITGIDFLYANAARKFQRSKEPLTSSPAPKEKEPPVAAKPKQPRQTAQPANPVKAAQRKPEAAPAKPAEKEVVAKTETKTPKAFEIFGNTLISSDQIKPLLINHKGRPEIIKKAIYQLYHEQGHYMVAIAVTAKPEQMIVRIFEIPAIRDMN